MRTSLRVGGAKAPPRPSAYPPLALLLRAVPLALLDVGVIWLLSGLLRDGAYALAIAISVVTLLLNLIFLRPQLSPLQWIAPSLALLGVLVVYPVFSTLYTAFTNYGDGHLLTKQVAIQQLEKQVYLPEGAPVFAWTAYVSADNQYLLWLHSADLGATYIARPGKAVVAAEGEPPPEIDGYRQLSKAERLRHTQNLVALEFGSSPDLFRVSERQIGVAAQYQQRYSYDSSQDLLIDRAEGRHYRPVEGTFTAEDGSTLRPGFRVAIGLDNFNRLLTTPALRGPFVSVFLWTILFAALSVLITFALGLFLAVMFDVPEMPLRRPLRSLLLIPYAIPAFISVPIWVGLLNPQYGVVSGMLADWFGAAPPWFSNPYWAKVGVLLIQLWLGFPYMFVIATGALQSLPADVYEAAEIDGASPVQAFWTITLPLLMITMGPLLVASFAYNFNNFVVIDLFNKGGPPISGTISPVGHTDILVTYTYRIAFSSGRGADLGYAAAITVAIFLILVVITYFQFRYTNMLEERSENV